MGARNRYLLVSQVDLLRMWGREVYLMFDEMPYLVGSALQHQDWRDVDVRLIVDDEWFDRFIGLGIDLDRFNLAVSLWGQQVTGLPIDFQVQAMDAANEQYDGPRDPIGLPAEALMEAKKARRA